MGVNTTTERRYDVATHVSHAVAIVTAVSQPGGRYTRNGMAAAEKI